ncbi:MAG: hypothetical protein EXS51_02660 [Candidatus Taylorbacteria bacterium]|nr:hypothetical protein [Candidatus Taylorbacteria bacterium]
MYDNNQQGGYKGGKDKRQFDGPKQMFSAICADCRKSCQVPFRPSGDKPIYCKDCFMKRKEKTAGDTWRPEPVSQNAPKQHSAQPQTSGAQFSDLKRQMDALSAKMDTILEKFEGAGTRAKKSTVKKVSAKKPKRSGKTSKK